MVRLKEVDMPAGVVTFPPGFVGGHEIRWEHVF